MAMSRHRQFICMLIMLLFCACATWAQTSSPATEPAATAAVSRDWFDPARAWMLVMLSALCGSVLVLILMARNGFPMWVREIAALKAVDEAVGRATEMGRPCLFIPGIQDMDDMG